MYAANEIMFPAYLIPRLGETRGPKWQHLIEHLTTLPETHEEVLAFMLLMVRLNGCMECETDSYRAMRGCEACVLQTLRRHKASDDDLLRSYNTALEDMRRYIERKGRHNITGLFQTA